jgi:hypothetical protein
MIRVAAHFLHCTTKPVIDLKIEYIQVSKRRTLISNKGGASPKPERRRMINMTGLKQEHDVEK